MKQQEMKINPLMSMLKKSLLDLPTPTSISMLWNVGFILGFNLTLQIVTGLMVSMFYSSDIQSTFEVMVKIMRDINMGWITRMIHMNGASLLFVMIYVHIFRGVYFSSPANQMKVWVSGMLIILMVMATSFLGYVLPWGQMSFWGATVITGVMSAIPILGNDLVVWIWGGSSVSQPTLKRFFSLHFLLPMMIMVLMLGHLIFLHEMGSSNPKNILSNTDKMKFNPMFTMKDYMPIILISLLFMTLITVSPNLMGDVENFSPANPLMAPVHIQPEWYFLFAYVVLRSIPSKLGGVVALLMSIMIISVMMVSKSKSTKFSPYKKLKFWLLVATILVMTWIGAKTVESPYEEIGQIHTIMYFFLMMTM